MDMFSVACHCGNIKLVASDPSSEITSCNCSFRNRLGALWAYYGEENVGAAICDAPISSYSWGEKTITYHRCENCGCTTHHAGTEDHENILIAIKCKMAPLSIISNIPVREFDGLFTWINGMHNK